MNRALRTAVLTAISILPAIIANAGGGTVTFHVSPSGNDNAAGTDVHPWRSIEKASRKASSYMKANPGTAVKLVIDGGVYRLREELVFEGLEAPLTLEASGNGEPVLSGCMPVSGWKKLSDRNVLSKLPKTARGRIWQADLSECGVEDAGEAISEKNRVDFYYNGKRQTLSRWPNEGFATAGKACGATDLGDTWIHVHGTKEGVIEYLDDRISRWADEKDPCMAGYWYWDWQDGYQKIGSIDIDRSTVTLIGPWSTYGYRDGMRFYGLNLLCELDSPGEYYIDREKGRLYWYAPYGFDGHGDTELSVFNRSYMVHVTDCGEGVTIRGISFEGGRRGAVQVVGGRCTSVCGCRFSRFGGTAVSFVGGWEHKVQGCLFEELGCGGLWMKGGDRKTLRGCGFIVEDSIVDNFSLFKRTYEPAVYLGGVGITLAHCLFQHAPSSALRLDGNDMTVEYCQFYDLVLESDDQGGADSWFNYSYRGLVLRYNHWRDISGGMFAGAAAIRFDDIISGNTVYGNVIERCGGGGFGGININGGRDNRIFNNIFYDCPFAVSGGARQGDDWRKAMADNKDRIDEVDALGALYESRYPEIRSSFYSGEGYNYVHNNIVVNARQVAKNPQFSNLHDNTEIQGDTLGLSHYLQESVQRGYGLAPIPFEEIGVKENSWLRNRN